jgi:hypothetical protein
LKQKKTVISATLKTVKEYNGPLLETIDNSHSITLNKYSNYQNKKS